MLYILATSPVEATVYATATLGMPLRTQGSLATVLMSATHCPARFEDDDVIKQTPEFERLSRPREAGWSKPGWTRNQYVADQDDRAKAARLATTVRMRGGKILPAYDVPEELTPEAIEKWLAEG